MTHTTKNRTIEIHSQEVNDILSRPPAWILRWGITLFLIIIVVAFVGSIFFTYPDVISAPVTISSTHLPVHLRAKTGGKIVLLVQESDTVQSGVVAAVIESATDYNDFIALQQKCDRFQLTLTDFPLNLKLGSIQSSYTQFLKSLNDYRTFLDANYHAQKIAIIRKQMVQQQEVLQSGERQLRNYEEQFLIQKGLYARDSALFAQGVIPQAEMEQSRLKRLVAAQQHESLKSSITNMKLTLLQSEQLIFELTQEQNDRRLQLENSLTGNFDNLVAQMAQWEQTNLLISPIAGTVVFTQYWQDHQNVYSGDLVLTIVPQEKRGNSGKLYLPLQGAGKVKTGQQVNIKLDNFPYMEFGMVEARIDHISAVPVELNGIKMMIADVSFPKGLITNYNISVESGEEMNGTGDIITENISLFARFFNPIKHVFKSRT